jgi:DNA-binding NtrC family response regulator
MGTSAWSISPAALELLQQYDWPGNVPELQSIIRESLILSAGIDGGGAEGKAVQSRLNSSWRRLTKLVAKLAAGPPLFNHRA